MAYLNKEFTLKEVEELNREWGKNRIQIPHKNENMKYKIYDTGNADLDGRYCVAIYSYINPIRVKKYYNLWI